MTESKRHAVFLDRDGTLNAVLFNPDGSARSPRALSEFNLLPGVKDAVSEMRKRGYEVIVVTNQPEVVRGLLNMKELQNMNAYLQKELMVADIEMCLHDNKDACGCRKPKPGMLIRAAEKQNIDLAGSFMIGDTERDMGAGKAAGCSTIIIDASYNKDVEADHRVASLTDALRFL